MSWPQSREGTVPGHSRVNGLLEFPNSGKNPANVVQGPGLGIRKITVGKKQDKAILATTETEKKAKTGQLEGRCPGWQGCGTQALLSPVAGNGHYRDFSGGQSGNSLQRYPFGPATPLLGIHLQNIM